LAKLLNADVVALVENRLSTAETLTSLKTDASPKFIKPDASLSRFQVFAKEPSYGLSEALTDDRMSLRRLRYDNVDFLLGIIHFFDLRSWGRAQQAAEVQGLVQSIRLIESDTEHNDRTILIGDFNMNPFDKAMNLARGWNALMSASCVRRRSRELAGREYPFFYNPMWALFGDRAGGPPGTFYHRSSAKGTFGWNMLDQVLIRPSALPWFAKVEIITEAGPIRLATRLGRPKRTTASDHFPLLLTLR
jgi:endonuclease/exonuclease/phosphatase (EEP) superfamily protein YafD